MENGVEMQKSMIPLIYEYIRVATYKLILNLTINIIMGYQFINSFGNMKDINTSILILVNINKFIGLQLFLMIKMANLLIIIQ